MDPLEALQRWRAWSATGTPEQLSHIVKSLEAGPPQGWRLANEEEVLQYWGRSCQDFHPMKFEATPEHPAIMLTLSNVRGPGLHGGSVWFDGPPGRLADAALPPAWREVMRFLDDGVVPAATVAGVHVRIPSFGELFLAELPYEVRDRLEAVGELPAKFLPLDRHGEEAWHDFVVAAHRHKTPIDERGLDRWLTGTGWPQSAANELTLRLYDQSRLLSRYSEQVWAV